MRGSWPRDRSQRHSPLDMDAGFLPGRHVPAGNAIQGSLKYQVRQTCCKLLLPAAAPSRCSLSFLLPASSCCAAALFISAISSCSASSAHQALPLALISRSPQCGTSLPPGFLLSRMTAAWAAMHSAFDTSYGGNRAPLPIYVHSYWFSNSTVTDMQRFTGERDGQGMQLGCQQRQQGTRPCGGRLPLTRIPGCLPHCRRPAEYALSKPHTYFATMRQLLAWMQNPVPAAELTPSMLGCGSPGGAGGPLPQPAT